MSQALARDMSPPPHNTGQLHWQIALCGGGGGRGEQLIELKNLDKKIRSSYYLPLSVMVQVWYKIANLTDGSNLRCKTIANQKQSPYFI